MMHDNASILIIDDEKDIRLSLRGIFEDENWQVTEAGTGTEGLGLALDGDFDLIFLDIWMPGMDGIQVLREIKLRFPQVQVLMLTGHADMEVAISGMAMGAFDYLMKPVELDVLVGKIREACSRSRKAGERRGLE